MKKIIIAFDGTNFSHGAFEFARRLNELQPIFLTGVFLPQTSIAGLWSYAESVGGPFVPMVEPTVAREVVANIEQFRKLCTANHVEYSIHKDLFSIVIPELKSESRFADLLILSGETFYEYLGKEEPNAYLKEALHEVKCPVLIVPESFSFPESVILAYDGRDDSIFSIKQFAYLFPELADRNTLLVYANADEKEVPEKEHIEELARRHYKNLTSIKLDIEPRRYFPTWLKNQQPALLVCGSYGRSGISRLFTSSFVKEVIAEHALPVFIAHR